MDRIDKVFEKCGIRVLERLRLGLGNSPVHDEHAGGQFSGEVGRVKSREGMDFGVRTL